MAAHFKITKATRLRTVQQLEQIAVFARGRAPSGPGYQTWITGRVSIMQRASAIMPIARILCHRILVARSRRLSFRTRH
jgi:hypothetical protein